MTAELRRDIQHPCTDGTQPSSKLLSLNSAKQAVHKVQMCPSASGEDRVVSKMSRNQERVIQRILLGLRLQSYSLSLAVKVTTASIATLNKVVVALCRPV